MVPGAFMAGGICAALKSVNSVEVCPRVTSTFPSLFGMLQSESFHVSAIASWVP